MSIQVKKVRALFKKDLKDALKNGNFLLLAAMPIVLTLIYRLINFDGFSLEPEFVLTFGLLMALTLVPLSTTSMMIAEEKEKSTLRTLMLSNVSAGEFLISKALVIFVLVELVCLVIYMLTGLPISGLGRMLLVTAASSVSMILLGALIGIVSKNQMSTGMLSAPLALVLLMPAIFAQMSDGVMAYARFLPTTAMLQMISMPQEGILFPLMVILVWTVLSAVLFFFTYQRKRLD